MEVCEEKFPIGNPRYTATPASRQLPKTVVMNMCPHELNSIRYSAKLKGI